MIDPFVDDVSDTQILFDFVPPYAEEDAAMFIRWWHDRGLIDWLRWTAPVAQARGSE